MAAQRSGPAIFLLGQPYWVARLGESLSRFGCGSRVCALRPGAASFLASIADARRADIFLRVGFRPGAPTIRGRAFDALWAVLRRGNSSARAAYYWIGSDVLHTLRDCQSGVLRRRPFEACKRDAHIAEAPWLAEELEGIGIQAKVVRLPALLVRCGEVPALPAEFAVLSHVPDQRLEFYGGEMIYEAAARLPAVRFDIVAGRGAWVGRPLPNLRFHGWQRDMAARYADCSVVVRMVRHDGLGLTIQEALSFGRHAIYSYPFPHTCHVAFGDTEGLISCLAGLRDLHQRGQLAPNAAGSEYAREHFDAARDTQTLFAHLARPSGA